MILIEAHYDPNGRSENVFDDQAYLQALAKKDTGGTDGTGTGSTDGTGTSLPPSLLSSFPPPKAAVVVRESVALCKFAHKGGKTQDCSAGFVDDIRVTHATGT